jgi:DNA-binding SARP family transcriptional activator
MMSGLKLYLFGSPRLERDGESVHIVRRKASGLLAYLVTTQQHQSREALATVFWPEYNRRQGRADLSRTLSVLNKALGPDWLVADRETVSLNPEAELWVDVRRFRQVQAARGTHGHPDSIVCAACLPLLAEAVTLYQADFLAGFTLAGSPAFDEWQLFQTEALRRELTGALDRLGQGYSAQGDWATAISYARQWVDLEPLHESAHCLLMRLYVQSGQRTIALTQYETCRQLLDEELGVPPSEETQSLYEQIRLGESAIAPVVAQPTDLLPKLPSFLGDGEAPVADERPVFVAREREVGRLDEQFRAALDGGGRVVFVTGEAGRGKTALLGEFARRAQANQADLIVVTGNCSAYTGLGDPYLPFRDVMGMLSGDVEASWAAGIITKQHALRLWTLIPQTVQALVEAGSDLIEVFVSGIALVQRAAAHNLGETGQLQQLQTLMQQIQAGTEGLEQRHLFEQYTQVLRTLARRQPLLVLLDDLQWADGASINLLFHLGRRLAGSRILILGAYRPSEVALGRPVRSSTGQDGQHPLKLVVNELTRQSGDIRIDLGQMTPAEGRDFVEALLDSQPNRLSETFRTVLFKRTKGHPLFTVELLRDMQERGDLIRDKAGDWIEGPALIWDALPARVEAVIEQRLDRLEAPLQEILAASSIEGEEFTAQIVARLQGLDELTLLRQLSQELVRRHRLVRECGEEIVGQQRLSRYQFSHVLYQQYLYDHLSPGERRLLHGQIAALLEEIYTGHTGQVAAQLARHYVEAGEGEQAIGYLIEAGDQARGLYAYQAAVDHYQQALAFLKAGDDYEKMSRTLMKLGLSYHLDLDFQRAAQVYEEGFSLWQQVSQSKSASPYAPSPQPLRGHWSAPATVDPGLAGQIESLSLIDQLFSGLVELSPLCPVRYQGSASLSSGRTI